ncbi:thiolase C-terminal domain-containing protein [Variovorax sp. PBL-E5]|uniref:thiolase C-terminal domain-containing protein n=1 Tax=Variovorax sp. PBL-E5 TaxID=434014 RepID=UPI001316146F|nr:acetyl-CoA acetyltransferase [Variovorax sp. PBL-E5]VTU30859.1 lipid-transfer protein [Variovorax sp. PBL-E5]
MNFNSAASIAGIGWTDYTRNSGKTVEALALEACRNAIEDAGLVPADVDGIVSFGLGDTATTSVVATGLGLPVVNHYADYGAGGNMACGVVLHAAMAVATGQADHVLVYRALNGASGVRYGGAKFSELLAESSIHSDAEPQFLDTCGITMPAQHFAMLCRRHMIKYGTTDEDLAAVAMNGRAHAADNERAMKRAPMSLDDYRASPWIAEPFRMYDCCLQSDGACALLITSTERARDLRHRPVTVRAGITGSGPANRGLMWGNYWGDHSECYARFIADRLFGMAGIERGDLDFAQVYDCFTYSVIGQFEDFGLCEKGGAGAFFREGHARIGGKLPVNTAGGLLSEAYIHGLNNAVEAVSQLRGDAGTRQVRGAELGLVTAGGATSTGSALILGVDA